MTTRIGLFAISVLVCFSSSVASAGDAGQVGTVDFAFDGGTLKCEFGSQDQTSDRVVALIVHPNSVDALAARLKLTLDASVKGSTVLIVGPDRKYHQLDQESGTAWATKRISDMAGRESSVAENAFVAAVMHTTSSGIPINVWASEGVELLATGKWTALFNPLPPKPDRLRDTDPFDRSEDGG